MKHTLSTAAKATGLSRSTISKSIKSGKISASKNEHGQYEIDPSELHRVYPPVEIQQHSTQQETGGNTLIQQKEVEGLRKQVVLLESERDDLRRRLDTESEERRKLTLMLLDRREKKGLLQRIFA
jgi:hypothetical protein